jgi:hypothetical protein
VNNDVNLSHVVQNLLPEIHEQVKSDPAVLAAVNETLVEQKVVDPRVKTGLLSSALSQTLVNSMLTQLLPKLLPLAIHALIKQVGPQILSLANKYSDKLQEFMTPEDFATLQRFLRSLDSTGQSPFIQLSSRDSS